ncbi:hypothetical protein CB1_000539009 [Camelus ferus]|nr:hypothetical protein CB1_000539009 [Camelus ferus]
MLGSICCKNDYFIMKVLISSKNLKFRIFPDQVALEGVGHFPRISQGEARGPRASLEDAKPVGDRALLQNKQKPPQDEWGETQDAVEATGVLGKNLN